MGVQATSDLDLIAMPGIQTRLDAEDEKALLDVVHNASSYAIGPTGGVEGEAFEKAFIEMMGCGDAVSVNTCSSALELAAILSDLQSGDEAIVPAHTYVATVVPFAKTGAAIKWADIDSDTRTVSDESIESLITDRTKVIVVVHLYGMPANMDAIMELAAKHNIVVIEDCAQAPGAIYKGKRVGSIGDFGCFSFQSHKNITTLGEGGMLTVRDPQQGTAARRMRWMGNWPFTQQRTQDWLPAGGNLVEPIPGHWPGNYCMPEALAAVGRQQLKRLDAINEQRRVQALRFISALCDYPELHFQQVPDHCKHVYHLMAARYDGHEYGADRDRLMELIRSKYKVTCLVQYWPLYRSELFSRFGFGQAKVPETDRFFDNMISFPWWSDMGESTIDDMAQRTHNALNEMRG